ncbi:MAG: amino acid adenylation protein [Gammaproteobacteria bacterium]|nr:amino acid adenylation protein [Gammaproteobacteria bacterium]
MSMTRNVCSLFDQQVIQQPEKIAIYYSGITLTYQALDEQSNYLSNHLLSHAKQYDGKSGLSNDPVIVFMEKSLESIISIFAILKAGACYTPIDIDSPSERLKQIINESNASYILTTISAWGKIGSEISILSKVIFVDALLKNALLSEYTFHPNVKISPTDLAYIMFTSGSTGSPKGVMIEHGNLLASILARTESYPEKNQNCLLFSSLGFDTSITAIFWPLVQGGTLVIPEQSDSKDPRQIAHLIQKYKVTHLLITPSFYDLLLDQNAQHSLDSLQRVIVGGEQTHIFLVHKHKKNLPATFLTNEYGPTEASIWSTSIDLFDPKIMRLCEIVTVGHSAPHAKNYILNKNLQEVGVGETGEIYIAGDAVGRGYIGASDKECSNFMQDLIVIDKTGEKIKLSKVYKTGDLAKYLSSGEIVFIGRQDNQVKLGGQRVELSEIEAVLQSYKAVKQSIVRVKKGENYDYRLIAYITVAKPETFDIYVLRNFISKKLPSYMQPNEIIPLENFPLNQNGKINHLELLKLNEIAYENHILSKTSSNSYLEGQNRLVQCEYGQDQPEIAVDREVINKIEKICEIYRNILKKEVVMQHDNFFQLGGHSLLVVKTILEINQAFHSNITIRQFYSNPTPSGIVQCTIETGLNLPFYPLSYAQERMWFLHKYNNADDKHYNVAFWIEFFGELNVEALEKSLGRIIERHEVYRTVFVENDEGVFQQILPYKEFVLSRVQLRNVSAISHFISEDTSKSFNLSSGQLIRLRLITLNSQYHILLVNQHHIVHDGWSISLFKNELCSLYQYYAIGKELDLPNLPNQYKDFAQSQRQALLSGSYDSQLDYWISKLKNVSQLNLPTDYTRPLIQTYNGQHYKFLVSADLLQSIRAFASRLNLTVYMVLLTSFFILLSRYSNQKDIVTGTAIANRDDEKIQNLIGLFINTVAVRLQIEENTNIRELLLLVRDAVFEGLINKDVPFEHIINQLNLVRTIDKQPVFQTMFIYDRAEGDLSTLNLPGVRTAVHPAHNNTSKYDLSFNFQESTNNLDAFIEYNTDIYSNQSIANMAGHFLNLLNHITDDIEKNIYALNFITAEEQYLILNQWNAQPTFFNDGCLIHQLFEKHARISPQNPAIFCGEHFLTYEELNEQANQLAHYLYKKGVQPEEAIAVAIQRSFDLAIVLMAIFKVGAAYVPLDPNYPKARLQYMLENSEAKILITEAEIYADLNLQTSGEVIFIENIKNILNEEPRENLNIALRENNLALIHYTSGSTGDPKGVMLEQGDLCYCFKWLQKTFPLRSEDRMLQHTLYSFDVFICELFWPLIFGASSVLVEPHHEKDTW